MTLTVWLTTAINVIIEALHKWSTIPQYISVIHMYRVTSNWYWPLRCKKYSSDVSLIHRVLYFQSAAFYNQPFLCGTPTLAPPPPKKKKKKKNGIEHYKAKCTEYVLRVSFWSVLLYGQPFKSYYVLYWDKCTKWPENDHEPDKTKGLLTKFQPICSTASSSWVIFCNKSASNDPKIIWDTTRSEISSYVYCTS